MVYINLLPVRDIRRRARARAQLLTGLILFLLLLVALAATGLWQAGRIRQAESELNKLRQEKEHYSQIIRQIKKMEKEKDLLEKKISVIKKLKKSSSLTVHVLDEIANRTPSERMWLTELSQEGSKLQITGMALDNRTIANYMENLKNSPYIETVNLASSAQKTYAGRNLKAFSLSCSITVPDEEEKADRNDK